MSGYKSYRKEKWLYFVFCVLAYFLPFIIVTSVFFPMIEAAKGFKIAIGLGVVFINAIPFLMGIFRAFFAHFPMFNMLAVVFVALAAFSRSTCSRVMRICSAGSRARRRSEAS